MSLEDLSFEARDELAMLSKSLADNPATRNEFLRLTQGIRPDLPIPELEMQKYTESAVTKSNNRVEQLEAKLRERDAIDDLDRRRSKLMRKGLIQHEDEIEEVEKIMLEKGITNHEAAAEYWQWMKQSAVPTPSGYNPSAISKFDLNKFWKNPVAGARDEASKALADLRKGPRPIGL